MPVFIAHLDVVWDSIYASSSHNSCIAVFLATDIQRIHTAEDNMQYLRRGATIKETGPLLKRELVSYYFWIVFTLLLTVWNTILNFIAARIFMAEKLLLNLKGAYLSLSIVKTVRLESLSHFVSHFISLSFKKKIGVLYISAVRILPYTVNNQP